MRSLPGRLLPLLVAPFLASCVFLLDYDELQGGPEPNAGGAAPVGGQTSTAGAGGDDASSTCGDCNDHDACTIDTCDETGDSPVCTHEATEGLKLDGFETTLTSQRHVRVAAVAGGQMFYFATL